MVATQHGGPGNFLVPAGEMPKETIHFLVARAMRDELRGTAWEPVLGACPNALLLGAVFHDLPYYFRGDGRPPFPEAVAVLGDAFHGPEPGLLAAQAEVVRARPGDLSARAVFAGMVSHLFADAAVHPLVVHSTGDYNDPDPGARTRARRLHRALETALDMAAARDQAELREYSLRAIRAGFEGKFHHAAPLAWAAGLASTDEASMARVLDAALGTFALVRRLGLARLTGFLCDLLHPVLPDGLKEITALAYSPKLERAAAGLKGPLAWRDPWTGARGEDTLRGLMDRAARKSAEYCRRALKSLDSADPLPSPGSKSADSGPPLHLAPAPLVPF